MGKNILPYGLSTKAYLQWLAIVVDHTFSVFFNPVRLIAQPQEKKLIPNNRPPLPTILKILM
ncbi:hypothetical protein CEN50_10700 [Fischerella thermalis CCMEE 5268]|uniref:Uncharacterized protein n=1 Tax=Fischerella thermalis CCMEE 5268 TaxID=2019662 RepID=A0A2N6KGY7_9CYAN|nr:hypothetical protein CEN50_10700 [Fischerella thermalis CCMEE 5268]